MRPGSLPLSDRFLCLSPVPGRLELRFTPKINILVGTHPSKELSLVTELQLSRECLSQIYDTSSGLELFMMSIVREKSTHGHKPRS